MTIPTVFVEQKQTTFDPKDLTMEVVFLTPELAEEIKSRASKNFRKTTEAGVKKLAGIIERGEWWVNGATVVFDKRENLIDGFHRVEAVIRTGIAVWTCVVRGVDAPAVRTMDTNYPRKFADYLKSQNIKQIHQLAATVRQVYLHENGFSGVYLRRELAPTTIQLLNVLERHPDIENSVRQISRLTHGTHMFPRSALSFLHYIVSKDAAADDERKVVIDFFEPMCTGEGLHKTGVTSPMFRFRARMEKNHNTVVGRLQQAEKLALLIKAWNLYVRNRECATLTWRPKTEKFPKILGFEV